MLFENLTEAVWKITSESTPKRPYPFPPGHRHTLPTPFEGLPTATGYHSDTPGSKGGWVDENGWIVLPLHDFRMTRKLKNTFRTWAL